MLLITIPKEGLPCEERSQKTERISDETTKLRLHIFQFDKDLKITTTRYVVLMQNVETLVITKFQ